MNRIETWCATVLLAVAVTKGVWAEGQRVLLRTAGEVESRHIERVLPFCQENTRLDIQFAGPLSGEFETLNEVARAASEQLGEEDAFVIVLAGIHTEEKSHGICLHDLRAAVINVPAVLADEPDDERAGRRLERQVMQSIGMLVGMASCPNSECVLWPYSNMEELDAKGRNMCPPCFGQLQKKAEEQGLSLREVSIEEEFEMGEQDQVTQPE